MSVELDAVFRAVVRVDDVGAELEALARSAAGDQSRLRLGANPVGEAMARKSENRLNGFDSLRNAVDLLRDQVATAKDKLQQSGLRYAAAEASNAAGMAARDRELDTHR